MSVGLALISGLGYWLASGSIVQQVICCLAAGMAGWLTARRTDSYRSLIVVTGAALVFTLPTGLAPVPASVVLLGSLLGRDRSDDGE